jgi:hypothetical protein
MNLKITDCEIDCMRFFSYKLGKKQIARIYFPNRFHSDYVVSLSYCHMSAHVPSLKEASMLLNSDLEKNFGISITQ